jgi:hypothetical protein
MAQWRNPPGPGAPVQTDGTEGPAQFTIAFFPKTRRPAYIELLGEAKQKGTGTLVGACALLLWMYTLGVLVIGLVAAYLVGFLGETAGHIAWCVGAGLAAVGMPLGWVSISFGQKCGRALPDRFRGPGKPCGLLGSMLAGLFVGLLAGVLLGMAHTLMWYSLERSPFFPESWWSDWRAAAVVGGHVAVCMLLGVLIAPFANVRTYPSGS